MPVLRRRRRRWDKQPANPASVLLASDGRAQFSSPAVERAAELGAGSTGGPVAVVVIAKVHGTSFGLPNPGLMPTKAELKERTGWVEGAIRDLQRRGVDADGQVATTRRGTRLLARVARLRGVSTVVIDGTAATGIRRMVEGDPGEEIRRKLHRATGGAITVEIIPPAGA